MAGGKARGEDWYEQTFALIHASKKAMEAARARDADRVIEIGDEIAATCETCHRNYLPR
jgi:cytochrome c556